MRSRQPEPSFALRTAVGLLLALASAAAVAVSSPAHDRPSSPIEFNRDVRPILSDHCFTCHGPDSGKRKAKLRLDQREVAIAKEAIVPGDPKASELIDRIFADDPEEHMPPPETRAPLTAAQKEILRRWIAEGADYSDRPFLPLDSSGSV